MISPPSLLTLSPGSRNCDDSAHRPTIQALKLFGEASVVTGERPAVSRIDPEIVSQQHSARQWHVAPELIDSTKVVVGASISW